jgi:hypothetical protein
MTTNQSASSNLLCKPLAVLATLSIHDRKLIFDSLSHEDLVQLSACCQLLRKAICNNNNILWKKAYEARSLSDGQHNKEYDFIMCYARVDPKAPKLSLRRMGMLKIFD